jgi:hypothetical protein
MAAENKPLQYAISIETSVKAIADALPDNNVDLIGFNIKKISDNIGELEAYLRDELQLATDAGNFDYKTKLNAILTAASKLSKSSATLSNMNIRNPQYNVYGAIEDMLPDIRKQVEDLKQATDMFVNSDAYINEFDAVSTNITSTFDLLYSIFNKFSFMIRNADKGKIKTTLDNLRYYMNEFNDNILPKLCDKLTVYGIKQQGCDMLSIKNASTALHEKILTLSTEFNMAFQAGVGNSSTTVETFIEKNKDMVKAINNTEFKDFKKSCAVIIKLRNDAIKLRNLRGEVYGKAGGKRHTKRARRNSKKTRRVTKHHRTKRRV